LAKKRGLTGNDSELLFQKWLAFDGWVAHRAARAGFVKLPNGRSFCQSHDLFGCLDFIAFLGDRVWCVQVTTQAGRSDRRRKIEAVGWPPSWRVSVVSHETTEDPANRARKKHWWRCEDYGDEIRDGAKVWSPPVATGFDKAAVEQHAREKRKGAA
jgi:hypothetical protein